VIAEVIGDPTKRVADELKEGGKIMKSSLLQKAKMGVEADVEDEAEDETLKSIRTTMTGGTEMNVSLKQKINRIIRKNNLKRASMLE
jgi:hypothetical protein